MTDKEIQKKVKSLRGLVQYKDKSEDDLFEIARESLQIKNEFVPQFKGLSPEEKKIANEQYEFFCTHFHIESDYDLMLLEERVYQSAQNDAYKDYLAKLKKKASKSDSITAKDFCDRESETIYNARQKKIEEYDKKLGLCKDKKSSGLDDWELILEKAKKDVIDYPLEHVVKCPHCQEIFYLLYRVKNYNAYPYSLLKDNMLYNEFLMQLIDEKVLTNEQVAKIFDQQTTEYVDLMYNKVYLHDKAIKERDKK